MIAQALLEKEKINEEDFQRFLKNNLEVAKIRNFHFWRLLQKKQNGQKEGANMTIRETIKRE